MFPCLGGEVALVLPVLVVGEDEESLLQERQLGLFVRQWRAAALLEEPAFPPQLAFHVGVEDAVVLA